MATACCCTPAAGLSTRACPATVTSSTTAAGARLPAAAQGLMWLAAVDVAGVGAVAGAEGVAVVGAAGAVEAAVAKHEQDHSDLPISDNVAIQVDDVFRP